MALVAKLIDVRHVQQARVLRPVGCMAGQASLSPDGSVFVYERTAGLDMALGADGILVSSRLDVVVAECAVSVMAVTALDDAFIHLVVEGHVEGRLDVGMALEAEFRLRGDQKLGVRHRLVNAVATEAAYVCLGVRGTKEIRMSSCVAAEAGLGDLRGRELVEANDLGDIATTIDVRLAWAVAAFAGVAGASVLECQLGVRIID